MTEKMVHGRLVVGLQRQMPESIPLGLKPALIPLALYGGLNPRLAPYRVVPHPLSPAPFASKRLGGYERAGDFYGAAAGGGGDAGLLHQPRLCGVWEDSGARD